MRDNQKVSIWGRKRERERGQRERERDGKSSSRLKILKSNF